MQSLEIAPELKGVLLILIIARNVWVVQQEKRLVIVKGISVRWLMKRMSLCSRISQ